MTAIKPPLQTPWHIRQLRSEDIANRPLEDAIVNFDKQNMGPLLVRWSMPFPEDKRRRELRSGRTLQLALDNADQIIGYIEYGPDWKDAQDIYISSVQITPFHRGTTLFANLLAAAARDLMTKPFRRLTSNVQKHNHQAIAIYRRLGFTVDESLPSATLPIWADRTILEGVLAIRLRQRPHRGPHK